MERRSQIEHPLLRLEYHDVLADHHGIGDGIRQSLRVAAPKSWVTAQK
jgi:hypothetical protein